MSATLSASIAVSTTRSKKRKRIYEAPQRNVTLVALYQCDGRAASAVEVGSSNTYLRLLAAHGLVCDTGEVRRIPGKPGRPAVIFKLTDRGVKRARRALGEIK